MLTKEEIIASLKEAEAPKNKVVIVHTSLKKIGEIEGGGEGLLDALIEYFTAEGGLLCIPTHTWGWQNDTTVPTLDLCEPRSNIGVLPNIAARDKRATRSMHPTHSMAVFGDSGKVSEFLRNEELSETTSSPEGCYGNIYKMDGYVLLIGVGQEKNTFLHCVEEMIPVANRISDTPIYLTIKHTDGHIQKRLLYPLEAVGIDDVSVYFPNYEPAFRHHGCIIDGKLGNAKFQLCNARKMKAVMELIHKRSGGVELLADFTPINEEFYI